MKRNIVKVSLLLGLLLYVADYAYAYPYTPVLSTSPMSSFKQNFYKLFDVTQPSGDINLEPETNIASVTSKAASALLNPTMGTISANTELKKEEVPSEQEDVIYETVPPVYVDETEVPLNPSEVEKTVDQSNEEMETLEVEIAQREREKEEAIPVFSNFRQTFYSVSEGEVKVGYGLTYQDNSIKNINNVMHYYDDQYEWLPVVAVDIDEVLASGLDRRGVPNYYGTVLEIDYPNGVSQNAIVLDACGACSWDERIDLWLYTPDYNLDIEGIQYKVVRQGF